MSVEIEPTALFDHPTIGSLGRYVGQQMSAEPVIEARSILISATGIISDSNLVQDHSVVADACHLPTSARSFDANDLDGLSRQGCVTCRNVPLVRWDID